MVMTRCYHQWSPYLHTGQQTTSIAEDHLPGLIAVPILEVQIEGTTHFVEVCLS